MRLYPEILSFARIEKWRRVRLEQALREPDLAGAYRANMRYLKLVILVLAYALIPPAFAQTCCPAGCSQSPPGGCVVNGTQNSCGATFTCPPGSTSSSGGPHGPVTPGPTVNVPDGQQG